MADSIEKELSGIERMEAGTMFDSAKLTDVTNAETIASLYGDKLRFDHKRKRWLVWSGHIWAPDKTGEVYRKAISTVRLMYLSAANVENLEDRSKISNWAIRSESKAKLDAAVDIVKDLEPIADDGDSWDLNNMLLSCPNGIIDLSTGELRNGKPEDKITMSSTVEFDSSAECPRWEQFLSEIFQDDNELIHFIQKGLGYSITGSTREQVAFFCYGSGNNGKGVFFKTIRNILGDYAYDAPASLFQRNVMATNTNDVAATEFRRFLISSENLSASKINEQRLKGWTGGDRVTARYLYSEFFSFEPTVKPWLFINHKPLVDDDSFGFWRRVRLIPFNRKFIKGVDEDPDLEAKLKSEYKGILNWLVQGCLMWQKESLIPIPPSVESATRDYQIENDALSEFIFNECEEGTENEVKSSELYKKYNLWADVQGLKDKDRLSLTSFGRRMSDKYQRHITNKGKFYKGICIKSDGFGETSSLEVTGLTPKTVNPYIYPSRKEFTKNDPQPVTQPQDLVQPVTNENLEKWQLDYLSEVDEA